MDLIHNGDIFKIGSVRYIPVGRIVRLRMTPRNRFMDEAATDEGSECHRVPTLIRSHSEIARVSFAKGCPVPGMLVFFLFCMNFERHTNQ